MKSEVKTSQLLPGGWLKNLGHNPLPPPCEQMGQTSHHTDACSHWIFLFSLVLISYWMIKKGVKDNDWQLSLWLGRWMWRWQLLYLRYFGFVFIQGEDVVVWRPSLFTTKKPNFLRLKDPICTGLLPGDFLWKQWRTSVILIQSEPAMPVICNVKSPKQITNHISTNTEATR